MTTYKTIKLFIQITTKQARDDVGPLRFSLYKVLSAFISAAISAEVTRQMRL